MTRAELKRNSKEQIKGNLLKLFLCTLCFSMVSIAFFSNYIIPILESSQNLNTNTYFTNNFILKFIDILSKSKPFFSIIAILSVIIHSAIGYSISKTFLDTVRKKECTLKDFFKNIFNLTVIRQTLKLSILQGIYILLWTLLFAIPEFFIIGFILDSIAPGASIAIILFFPLSLIITLAIVSIPYSMSYYILVDNPNMTSNEIIKESKRIMKGHGFDYFVLQLSFIGWILLSIITFGLAGIYLAPYRNATLANFYEYIKNKND